MEVEEEALHLQDQSLCLKVFQVSFLAMLCVPPSWPVLAYRL